MPYIAMVNTDVADLSIELGGSKIPVKLTRGQEVPIEYLNPTDVKKSLMFGALGRLIKAGMIKEMDENALKTFREEKMRISPAQRETQAVTELYKKPAEAPKSAAKYANVSEVPLEEALALRNKKGIAQEMDLSGEKRAVAVDEMRFERAVVSDKSGGVVLASPELRKDTNQDTVVNESTKEKTLVNQVSGAMKDYESSADLQTIDTFDGFMKMNHFDKLSYVRKSENKDLLNEIAEKATVKQLKNESRKRLSELA